MKIRILFLCCATFCCPLFFSAVTAQNIYLKNGEYISGKILNIQENVYIIESNKGYGVLEIPEKDIIQITYPGTSLNLSRRYGVGYLSQRNISFAAGSQYDYGVDKISMKTYLDRSFFLQYLIGYGSINIEEASGAKADIETFASDLRIAGTLVSMDHSHVYTGISVGVLNIKDSGKGIDESGVAYSLFFGGEVFLSTLPDFGLSGELIIAHQSSKSLQRSDISITAIPTVSLHYYF